VSLSLRDIWISEKCTATNANGQQSKRTCCIGLPYCYIHLLHQERLRIKQSNIPNAGQGLFCIDKGSPDNTIIFRKDEKYVNRMGK
jgi:hypothetical protein